MRESTPEPELLNEDSKGSWQQRVMNWLILTVIVGAVAIIVSYIFLTVTGQINDFNDVDHLFYGSLIGVPILSIVYLINQRISRQLASSLFVVILILLAMFNDTPEQVVNGRALIVFVLPILVAGLLIRPDAGIIVATICSVIITLISFTLGLGIPNILGIILFFMIGVIIYLTSSSLIDAQHDIRFKGKTARDAAATANLYLDLMGHDIRNHLQAIVIATEILEDEMNRLEDPEFFQMIVTSVTASQTLIEKVQQIRTLQDTPLEDVSINEYLDDAIEEINSLYDVHVIKLVEKKDMRVVADFHLKTLFFNILENCVIHNDRDSKVIWTQMMETPNGFEISIADNGPGIPDAKKETIFDPERRFGGVGLHLAMKIVRKYNGALVAYDRIEKDPSQGSRFVIWLPQTS